VFPKRWAREDQEVSRGIGDLPVEFHDPLAYTTDIFDYALLPKRLALFVFLVLAAAGWLLVAGQSRNSLAISTPTCLLMLYCGLAALSMVNATAPAVRIAELLFHLALASLFLIGTTASKRDIKIWMTTLVATAGLLSVVGILQFFDLALTWIPSNGYPSATFGYRNFAAMFLVGVIPVTVFRFRLSNSKPTILGSALVGTLCALFLLYTRTRGAGLGAAAGTLFSLFVLGSVTRGRDAVLQSIKTTGRLKPIVAGVSIVVLALAGPLTPRFTDTGLQRFDEKKADLAATAASILSESGDRGRWQMWERSLPLIWEHLLTGVGPGHWEYVYPHYDRGAMVRTNSTPKRPHNDYIWIAGEHGLPALVAFVVFLTCVIVFGIRRGTAGEDDERRFALIAVAVIVGASVHALFSFPKEQPQIAMLFYLFAGVAVGRKPGRTWPAAPVSICVLLIGLAGGHVSWQQIQFDRHFLAGMISENSADWEEMKREANRGLALGEYRPHTYIILARAHEKLGQLEPAEKAYKRALELSPNSWHAHNGLGVIKKRRGRHEEALTLYERALQINPSSTSIQTNLGALYRAMGNNTKAEVKFRAVLQSEPESEGANNNLGNILVARGEVDSAEVHFRRALEANPDLPQAHQNLGDIFLGKERYEQAIEHYLKALDGRPNKALIHWSLATAYEASARLLDAEDSYRRAITVDPLFPRPYFSLGTMLFGLHRWQETIDLFEHFLTIWEGDPKFADFASGRIKASQD
jgi:tetratricopeptide (TPR) repeat protein